MSSRQHRDEVQRWDPAATMTQAEQRAVARLRQVGPPAALSDEASNRIRVVLLSPHRPVHARRRAKVATLGAISLGLAAAAGLHLAGRRPEAETVRPVEPSRITGVVTPPSPPAVALDIAPIASPPAAAKPTRRSRPPSPSVAPPEDPLTAESRQVGKALQQLRIEKDAAGALETLADYRRRFPSGLLSGEARLAELDANLALGRSAQALQLLDEPSLLGGSGQLREAEFDLLRAELLVQLDRCGDARPGLDRRIAASPGNARLSARALYLRALCSARDADGPASQSDLEEYLRRFPDQSDRGAVEEALHRMSAGMRAP